MSQFTVFGMHSDGLRLCEHVNADSWVQAVHIVARQHPDSPVTIVAVISGHHHDLLAGDYVDSTKDISQ